MSLSHVTQLVTRLQTPPALQHCSAGELRNTWKYDTEIATDSNPKILKIQKGILKCYFVIYVKLVSSLALRTQGQVTSDEDQTMKHSADFDIAEVLVSFSAFIFS